ncbi:hypothetical protein PQB73_gp219 [Cronobacter phage LPCS28]|uniref:Uncharacterized protein n=1 Tax=Cronobacter phage LPCS28 TaxID=2924885 RepID=A0AAE9GCX9_9CAUD|nr:hypothetical protein PQB73_gp219 [Cronobacter phage LPCS28]UNY46994.1 hypothetical protein EHEKIMEA_00112 [Cronobacter phage LPCS28]
MAKLNSRFVAFLKLHEHKKTKWKDNRQRNAAYICFINDMVFKYTGAQGCLDSICKIEDQEEFTKFIENFVDSQIKD